MNRILLICVGLIGGVAALVMLLFVMRDQPVAMPEVVIEELDDGCIPPPRLSTRRHSIQAIASGVDFLIARQSEDGAWRSDVYATFKDGTALTPFAITTLQEAQDAGVRTPRLEVALKKGIAWLARLSKRDGTIDPGPDGFDYPLYTATLAIKAYSHVSAHDFLVARDGWVKYLKERQLTEKLGWKPDDKQYGGWGYCRVIPKKPEPNVIAPSLIESNLSATVFALDTLKTAGELDETTAVNADWFVRHCQNEDGGFHFIYDDPTRNKAGMATTDPQTFYSYGSTTADGVRALSITEPIRERAKFDPAKPGVFTFGNPTPWVKGAQWLQKNFDAATHPGKYVKAHEPNREAVYYYYAASVAKAFRVSQLTLPDERDWADELSRELIRRQKPDGSWVNPVELVRENDPIVATCSAISALATCNLPKP